MVRIKTSKDCLPPRRPNVTHHKSDGAPRPGLELVGFLGVAEAWEGVDRAFAVDFDFFGRSFSAPALRRMAKVVRASV